MQHYAAKTIENLASQGGEWVDALATGTVAERLAAIWGGARTDALRSCAASALCRLARHSQNRLLPLLASQRSILHLVRTCDAHVTLWRSNSVGQRPNENQE